MKPQSLFNLLNANLFTTMAGVISLILFVLVVILLMVPYGIANALTRQESAEPMSIPEALR